MLPADLPIPSNLTYVVVASETAPDKWMKTCCGSQPVHVVEVCWEWCELTGNVKSETALNDFNTCLRMNGRNISQSNILAVHEAAATTVPIQPIGATFALVTVILAAMNIL